mgnify:FL=1
MTVEELIAELKKMDKRKKVLVVDKNHSANIINKVFIFEDGTGVIPL